MDLMTVLKPFPLMTFPLCLSVMSPVSVMDLTLAL